MTHPQSVMPQRRPAVAEYLRHPQPGLSTDGQYVVLPRVALERLAPAIQQQVVSALALVHAQMARTPWPLYRVVPCTRQRLRDLDEQQLRTVGVMPEVDYLGALVYRDMSTGKLLTDESLDRYVLVPTTDPLTMQQP